MPAYEKILIEALKTLAFRGFFFLSQAVVYVCTQVISIPNVSSCQFMSALVRGIKRIQMHLGGRGIIGRLFFLLPLYIAMTCCGAFLRKMDGEH